MGGIQTCDISVTLGFWPGRKLKEIAVDQKFRFIYLDAQFNGLSSV